MTSKPRRGLPATRAVNDEALRQVALALDGWEPRSLLDVGAGSGQFAQRVVDAGFHVTCLEGVPERAAACELITKTFNVDLDEPFHLEALAVVDAVVAAPRPEHLAVQRRLHDVLQVGAQVFGELAEELAADGRARLVRQDADGGILRQREVGDESHSGQRCAAQNTSGQWHVCLLGCRAARGVRPSERDFG